MEQELDYAEMLEIPVNTVNVVKKKGLNLFKRKAEKEQPQEEELKDMVVENVNERMGAYVYAEDVSDPPQEEKKHVNFLSKDKGTVVLISELAAACALAVAIFLTNLFMPTSLINTFVSTLGSGSPAEEPAYTDFTLTSVVSDFSDAEITVAENGVLSFTAEGAVYPVCKGKIASITEQDGVYTVQIAHTSTFSSVITGLTQVYSEKGTEVAANLPFGYSDGSGEVKVSMYDGETLLNCYKLSGEVPVWNS